jgi:galactose oxidase
LPNGSIFFAGGDVVGDAVGSNKSGIFDFFSNSWTMLNRMATARWYPSALVTLTNEILVVGGTIDSYQNPAKTPEIYNQITKTWRTLTNATDNADAFYDGAAHFYPWLYNLPNGKVANLGPRPTITLIQTLGAGTVESFAKRDLFDNDNTWSARAQNYGSVARIAVNQVLAMGGGIDPQAIGADESQPHIHDVFDTAPAKTANIIELDKLTQAKPVVGQGDPDFIEETGRPAVARANASLVILPTGDVMLTGGSSMNEGGDRNLQYDSAVRIPELWNRSTGTWSPLETHSTRRIYHSIALLQKDGTVLQGGGSGIGGTCNEPRGARNVIVKGPTACKQLDIYEPGYLFDNNGNYKPRPTLTNLSRDTVNPGASITINSDSTISKVTFVKAGNMTHATNIEQYFLEPTVAIRGGQANITLPNGYYATPRGRYFMYVWDNAGTPSIAQEIVVQ